MLCTSDLAWKTKSICHSGPYLFKTKEASLFLRWSLHVAPGSPSISLPWSSICNREEKIWNMISPLSRLCPSGWTFKGRTFFIHIEIKICRTESNFGLLQVYRNVMTARSTNDSGTEKFATTDHTSSPFNIKEAWILTLDTLAPSSSWFAGFPNKVVIPCPNTSSLDLLFCHAVSNMSLDLATLSLFNI